MTEFIWMNEKERRQRVYWFDTWCIRKRRPGREVRRLTNSAWIALFLPLFSWWLNEVVRNVIQNWLSFTTSLYSIFFLKMSETWESSVKGLSSMYERSCNDCDSFFFPFRKNYWSETQRSIFNFNFSSLTSSRRRIIMQQEDKTSRGDKKCNNQKYQFVNDKNKEKKELHTRQWNR